MNLETMLNEEIARELELLKDNAYDMDDRVKAIDGIGKLCDRFIAVKESNENFANGICDRHDEARDKKIKNALTFLGIAVPTVTTVWGTFKVLKFEETGVITTNVGKKFIEKLFRKN